MPPVNVVLLDRVVHVVAQVRVNSCISAALVRVSGDVCPPRRPDRAETVPSHGLCGALAFNYLHADVVLVVTHHTEEAQALPVEVRESTPGLGRGATMTENGRS